MATWSGVAEPDPNLPTWGKRLKSMWQKICLEPTLANIVPLAEGLMEFYAV